jgi:hypothetical protein
MASATIFSKPLAGNMTLLIESDVKTDYTTYTAIVKMPDGSAIKVWTRKYEEMPGGLGRFELVPYDASSHSEWIALTGTSGMKAFVDTFRILKGNKVELYSSNLVDIATFTIVHKFVFQSDNKEWRVLFDRETSFRGQNEWVFTLKEGKPVWNKVPKADTSSAQGKP